LINNQLIDTPSTITLTFGKWQFRLSECVFLDWTHHAFGQFAALQKSSNTYIKILQKGGDGV